MYKFVCIASMYPSRQSTKCIILMDCKLFEKLKLSFISKVFHFVFKINKM